MDPENRAICLVCCKQFSLYICPRCNVRYCSLACYKSHSDKIANLQDCCATPDTRRRRMLKALQRFHSGEEDHVGLHADNGEEDDNDDDVDGEGRSCLLSETTLEKIASDSSSPVASPRRTLSVSRERAYVLIVGEGEGDRNKQGAKPAEVYGFAGSIATIVCAVLFFGWAYLPESWLYSMGITYYPSRYWAVAFPAYAMMLILFVCIIYTSLNYIATIPPDSWNSLCDEFTRAPVKFCVEDALRHERPIDPISDIPITEVNLMMFGSNEKEL